MSGDVLNEFPDERDPEPYVYSDDGKYIAAGSDDGSIKIWDAHSTELICNLKSHITDIHSLSFSPDSAFLFSSSFDGTQKLWNIPSGTLLYTVMFNSEGANLTWTPEGYFSGNEMMAKKAVFLIEEDNVYSIDQLFSVFYRPDIIVAKVSGMDISSFSSAELLNNTLVPTPKIKVAFEYKDGNFKEGTASISDLLIIDDVLRIHIIAEDTGGGIGEIRLYHNGSRVLGGNRGIAVVKNNNGIIFNVNLVNGKNRFQASAFTETNIESRPLERSFTYRTANISRPDMYILAIGINKYKNSKYNLNYAVNDAQGFIETVQSAGQDLFRKINVELLLDEEVTKKEILSAFNNIQNKAKAEDVFLFFYAGHGIALQTSDSNSEFFFIPRDVTQMTDIEQIQEKGLSGRDFEELVSLIPAHKQLIILDACNSGALNETFALRGAAEEIALSRLSRSTGSALIAASRADQFAQEFAALGQGALTKTIIDGFAGEAALVNKQITVASLKSYIEFALPDLTSLYNGQAQYPTGFIFGQDFPIGIKQ
jgi:Caspase domain/WD domain, G-beta repeat